MKIHWIEPKEASPGLVSYLLKDSLANNHFANGGPAVRDFEQYLEDRLQVTRDRVVILTSNGSSALHCILNTFILEEGVISPTVPSFTFPCNIQGPLSHANVCDVGDDLQIPLEEIPDYTDCLVATNLFGMVQRHPTEYEAWAKEHKSLLVFDNAATPFSFFEGKNIVNFGDACILSFHHTKQLGFGECGAIVAKKEYEKTLRSLLNFGIPTGDLSYGMNGKASDVAAAYVHQYWLENLREIKEHHPKLIQYYKTKFSDFPTLPDMGENSVPSCFPLFLGDQAGRILKELNKRGIEAKKYYLPLSDHPNANRRYNEIICLPCNLAVTIEAVDYIREVFDKVL